MRGRKTTADVNTWIIKIIQPQMTKICIWAMRIFASATDTSAHWLFAYAQNTFILPTRQFFLFKMGQDKVKIENLSQCAKRDRQGERQIHRGTGRDIGWACSGGGHEGEFMIRKVYFGARKITRESHLIFVDTLWISVLFFSHIVHVWVALFFITKLQSSSFLICSPTIAGLSLPVEFLF